MFLKVLVKVLKSILAIIGALILSPIILLFTLVYLIAAAAESPWHDE